MSPNFRGNNFKFEFSEGGRGFPLLGPRYLASMAMIPSLTFSAPKSCSIMILRVFVAIFSININSRSIFGKCIIPNELSQQSILAPTRSIVIHNHLENESGSKKKTHRHTNNNRHKKKLLHKGIKIQVDTARSPFFYCSVHWNRFFSSIRSKVQNGSVWLLAQFVLLRLKERNIIDYYYVRRASRTARKHRVSKSNAWNRMKRVKKKER